MSVFSLFGERKWKMEGINNLTNSTNSAASVYDGFSSIINTLYVVLMLAGISGNTLVIVTIAKFENLRNVGNVFIACLAVSDLFGGFSLLFQISLSTMSISYGMCVIQLCLFLLSYTSSVLFLLGKYWSIKMCSISLLTNLFTLY